MPKTRLTSLSVTKLPKPAKGRIEYFDQAFPAFGLRISHSGKRNFFVTTRLHGKQVRFTLGNVKLADDLPGLGLAEARKIAGDYVEQASAGLDPRTHIRKGTRTFADTAQKFLDEYAIPRLSESTVKEYHRSFFGTDAKSWQDRDIESISRQEIRELLEKMTKRGSGGAANNRLAYLRKFFNWCADQEFLETPPTDRIKPPAPKNIGERFLDEQEIADLWQALDAEGSMFADITKLLLLTGQRRAEVSECRKSEFSADWNEWVIPGTRTKNKRPHIVPLPPQTADIFRKHAERTEHDLVFSTTGETAVSGHGKFKMRLDKIIDRNRQKENRPPMPSWRFHDLRRTMVTMMNEQLAIPPHVVEACVNHVSGAAKSGVAGVYNKATYLQERREAYCAWQSLLLSLSAQ